MSLSADFSKGQKDRRQLLESGQALPFVGSNFSAPEFFTDMEFRPVKNIQELKDACGLVYDEYLKLGYLDPNASRYRFTIYQTIPSTTTFVAVYRKKHVIGTYTTVIDSPLGLPMDFQFRFDLDVLRKRGHRLVETTMFAFNTNKTGIFPFPLTRAHHLLLVLYLFRHGFDYMRSMTAADMLVGCWHPQHELIYQFMQMRPFGTMKRYQSVKGNPAVARYLYVRWGEMNADGIPSMRFFFGHRPPPRFSFPTKPKFSLEDLNSLYVKSAEKPKRQRPFLGWID
jgi:hypothetical protein